YYERVQMDNLRFTGGRRRFAEKFERYASELRSLLNEHSSFTFRLHYYRINGFALGAAGRHTERIETMNEVCRYLDTVPHLAQRARYGEFKLQQLDSFMRTARFQEAEA